MADSFQCMTKPTTIKKIKKRERNYGVCSNPVKKKNSTEESLFALH